MTNDIHHPNDTENQSNDHHQAVEACQHAIDALHGGDLPRGRSLLDEAAHVVERAQHDDTEQAYRETVYDYYD